MRPRRRYLALTVPLGAAGAVVVALSASQAAAPSIVAVDPYSWQANGSSPAAVTIMAGGEVKFSYPSGATKHFPILHSGPAGASLKCTNVPATEAAAGPGWAGSCEFSQAGTYIIYCGVHGSLMTATVTVASVGEPTATTGAATLVTEQSAQLDGTVNPNGHPTTYLFKWGLDQSYGKETALSSPIEGTSPVAASASVSSLAAGTTYHFRLVAKNGNGTAEGADETFTTPGPPSATTGEALSVGETGATLKGTVNPDGKPTKAYFEWGTSESYGQVTAEVPAGEGHFSTLASAPLTGLAPGRTYHFRAVAKNTSSETAFGVDQTFTTASTPPPKEPTPPPTNPNPSPTPTPGPIAPEPELAPLVPPLLPGSLKLVAPHRGPTLRGSLDVSQSGAGGRLEVDLIASSASLARRGGRARQVIVGRLVRASVPAGRVSFSVALNARGRSALRRHHRLALAVKVTLTPPMGKAEQLRGNVVLRA